MFSTIRLIMCNAYRMRTGVPQAGRSGDLPKGSVKVGQSQSGATHYFEPAPAVPLNNAETLLEEAERKEEEQVREGEHC